LSDVDKIEQNDLLYTLHLIL